MSETIVERVAFRVDGEQVIGHLHRPAIDRPVPAVIVGGPMTSVKEQVTGVYAAALARHGIASLTIDHRHYGESEGRPRQYEHHARKRADLLAATAFLAARSDVDGRRLAGVGICLGAGYVASAVAVEPRLRRFVGVAGYYRDPCEMRTRDPASFNDRVSQGRQARLHQEATGEVLLIPAAALEGDAAMQTADTVDYYTRRAAVPNYCNAFAVMSREHFMPFDVQALASQIDVPTLLVHSEKALAPLWARRFHDALAGSRQMQWVQSEAVAGEGEGDADAAPPASPPSVIFHPASAIDADALAQVQTTLQKRILRAFVGRGLLESCDAKDMLAYQHSGFSVDAGVCIEAHDRAALERLLRYCARPPFAMDRLRKEGSALVYRCAKQRSEPTSDKRGAKVDEITLTPLELIARIAALVPPPRTHRHRYFGVLAPNSPLRAAVTALAVAAPAQATQATPAQTGTAEGVAVAVPGVVPKGNSVPPKRSPAHYLWAVLIARIYEVFPLLCPKCGGQMRLIAFITEGTQIRRILDHIGVDSEPPHIAPARGPPLWDDCDAQTVEGVHIEPDWDMAAQPAPDFEVDQRVNW